MKAYDYIITIYIWKIIFFYFVVEYRTDITFQHCSYRKNKNYILLIAFWKNT